MYVRMKKIFRLFITKTTLIGCEVLGHDRSNPRHPDGKVICYRCKEVLVEGDLSIRKRRLQLGIKEEPVPYFTLLSKR